MVTDRATAAKFRGAARPPVPWPPPSRRRNHYRYRCGIAWPDLPAEFGPWQTVWKRHRRFASDGTWDRIHGKLLAEADAAGQIDWTVSVDSTINRAHQHGTNLPRTTGGTSELQETVC
ncbi:hypothetical protein GCM10027038_19490 [Arthrobacter bambusae]